jgi:hypothetical protein
VKSLNDLTSCSWPRATCIYASTDVHVIPPSPLSSTGLAHGEPKLEQPLQRLPKAVREQ